MSELSAPPWPAPIIGFRSRKAAQLCAYFAAKTAGVKSAGTIERLKLIKLLYFAERKFISENHHPMLFDEYYSLEHGPICSSALDGINGIIHGEIWDNYIARNGNIVVAIKSLSRDEMDEVSDAELTVIDEIWKEFGHLTPSQLRNYSHRNCPEYTETKGRVAISYKQILRAVGVENPDVVANDIEEMIDLDVTLSD